VIVVIYCIARCFTDCYQHRRSRGVDH